jgi:ElaA protein
MDTNQMIRWEFKTFEELNVGELYELLKLRSRVFVVEQHCVFLDMDGLDYRAHHLMGYYEGTLAAYTRILPLGVSYPDYPSIGRVVTAPEVRGKAIGFALMQESIKRLQELYGIVPIKIGAQLYLKKFYESLGFTQSGEVYFEDGIEHIPMQRP